MTTSGVVIIAVQNAARAKSRLGAELDAGTRRTLVIAMLDDLLTAVREAWDGRVVVVSADPVYDPVAREHEAEVIRDAGIGYNEAVALALDRARTEAFALVMPGDLPHLRPADARALLDAVRERGVVVAPSSDGGTLALGLHPPGIIQPGFGANSAELHRRAATEARAALRELRLSFHNDVDTLQDLAAVWDRVGEATTALLEHLPLPTSGAPRE